MSTVINLLYIGYWAFDDGLTQSTILPHLNILVDFPEVDSIIITSIERDQIKGARFFENKKITHIPLHSKNLCPNILNKIYDFILFPRQLRKICKKYNIDHIICRGAPAGAIGYLVSKKTGISFSVESFEPHANYMLESSTWKRLDPRYIMQKKWEEKQKKKALMLMPVANNYAYKLYQEGISDSKIKVQPCEVDLTRFDIVHKKRILLRKHLGLKEETIVGIYVGKFGDIYWDREAFDLFKRVFSYFGKKMFLLILSPQPVFDIQPKLDRISIHKNYSILSVSFKEVPQYLNIADFAFSLIKSTPNRKYCSPIKNGEYWACGLPVLIPDGIGDDSQILKETGLGVVMEDLEHPEKYFPQLEALIKANKKEEIRQLAVKYRNPATTKKVYQKLIERLIKSEHMYKSIRSLN